MKAPFSFFYKAPGQGLSETGITIALIAVASLSGLTVLSGGLQTAFQSHHGDLHSGEVAELLVKPPVASVPFGSAGGAAARAAGAASTGASGSELSLELSNGQYIDLGNYPAELNQSIETTGASGTTSLLLATLDKVIQQSLANKGITQAEANSLMKLAQQGHHIADIQSQVIATALKGKPMSELSDPIGYHPSTGKEGDEILKFRSLFSNAQTANPAVNQTVSVLVNQVANISSGVENASYHSSDDWSVSDFNQDVVDTMFERDADLSIFTQQSLLDLGASTVSHQNSQQICKSGTGNTTNCTAAP